MSGALMKSKFFVHRLSIHCPLCVVCVAIIFTNFFQSLLDASSRALHLELFLIFEK